MWMGPYARRVEPVRCLAAKRRHRRGRPPGFALPALASGLLLMALKGPGAAAVVGAGGEEAAPPPAVSAAETSRPATMSVAEIAGAIARAHDRLRSIRATKRSWFAGDDPALEYVRSIVAAKGKSRYEWTIHVKPGEPRDPDEFIRFYDGTWFNVFYPSRLRYEISRRFAIRPFTDKLRLHATFITLAWWPPDDPSEPPIPDDRCPYFLKQALAQKDCRVRPRQEPVDGRWCHVVDLPGREVLWIDVERGTMPKSQLLHPSPEHSVDTEFYSTDYREVAPGIWLPYSGRREFPTSSDARTAHFQVERYDVNNVKDEQFSYEPEPGTVVYDRDTDTFRQVPGGFWYMENACDQAVRISKGSPVEGRSLPMVAAPYLVAFVAGLVLCTLSPAWLRSRRRHVESRKPV